MKKIQAYQCAYCPKASTSAGAMAQHEAKCKRNPNNLHKCFDYCTHLERVCIGYHKWGFRCEATGIMMYSFHAEKSSINLTGLQRMPLKCAHHKYMSDDEQAKRFEI